MGETCKKCEGQGYILKEWQHSYQYHTKYYEPCSYCYGTGEVEWIDNIYQRSHALETSHYTIVNNTSQLVYLDTKSVPLKVGINWIPTNEIYEYMNDPKLNRLVENGSLVIFKIPE